MIILATSVVRIPFFDTSLWYIYISTHSIIYIYSQITPTFESSISSYFQNIDCNLMMD